MARYPRLMPTHPKLFLASVARSQRISPSFQRVTVTGGELIDFDWQRRDHWFRLFLPPAEGAPLQLPKISGRSWWRSYLAIPGGERPHCSNYTVADFRVADGVAELDIDVVLHWHDGELGGTVANWAVSATPGSAVGLLDQGVMFDPPEDTTEYVLVADETGLPGLRSILRDLDAGAVGTALLEVPTRGDRVAVKAPKGVRVEWLPREDSGEAPGALALRVLHGLTPHPDAHAYVVGESSLATGGRRALRRAGLPSSRITFSGYWKA